VILDLNFNDAAFCELEEPGRIDPESESAESYSLRVALRWTGEQRHHRPPRVMR